MIRSCLRGLAVLGGVGVFSGLPACSWFEDPTPDTVRVLVTGDASTPAALIVSQSFNAGLTERGSTAVSLFAADTLIRTLPFDTVINLVGGIDQGDAKRFFFEAQRDQENLSNVQVRIYLDSDLRFDVGGPLTSQEIYRWAYIFNQLFTNVIEVI
ncbi:MAG: hypothetical protein R3E10_02340 [Gemmatimonadota bacterium]